MNDNNSNQEQEFSFGLDEIVDYFMQDSTVKHVAKIRPFLNSKKRVEAFYQKDQDIELLELATNNLYQEVVKEYEYTLQELQINKYAINQLVKTPVAILKKENKDWEMTFSKLINKLRGDGRSILGYKEALECIMDDYEETLCRCNSFSCKKDISNNKNRFKKSFTKNHNHNQLDENLIYDLIINTYESVSQSQEN